MNSFTQDTREEVLDATWRSNLPCAHCAIAEVCKYKDVIKRVDYPPEVFNISITCKITSKYTTTQFAGHNPFV